jgi:hypothetical protein
LFEQETQNTCERCGQLSGSPQPIAKKSVLPINAHESDITVCAARHEDRTMAEVVKGFEETESRGT